MTYEILPENYGCQPKYQWLLAGILLCAIGMLLSFPFQGYAFFSILFSTLFIFVSYVFSWVFIRDLLKTKADKSVKILAISSLAALILSSAGPFMLSYLLASHTVNALLYRDAIYTYLHLQYNGFFTLGIFALFVHHFGSAFSEGTKQQLHRFVIVLTVSVLPTLFLSYLWHFPHMMIRAIAIAGCVLLAVTIILFTIMWWSAKENFKTVSPFAKKIGALSMVAFALKTAGQIPIVFPSIGNMVFGNRTIIIAYLHLVMLGFITLYLLAHLVHMGYFKMSSSLSAAGIIVFISAIIANEVILMVQGFSIIPQLNSLVYPWLLWVAAIGLFVGALLMAASALPHFGRERTDSQ